MLKLDKDRERRGKEKSKVCAAYRFFPFFLLFVSFAEEEEEEKAKSGKM